MNSKVIWIGVRPERRAPVESRMSVYADISEGLTGDHETKPHRQVTLISQEAMQAAAVSLGREMDPSKTRRNILISGLDFNLPEGTHLQVGDAILEVSGPCLPCGRMDEAFGDGGRLAMADAGGLTTRIVQGGNISVGDEVSLVTSGALAQSGD